MMQREINLNQLCNDISGNVGKVWNEKFYKDIEILLDVCVGPGISGFSFSRYLNSEDLLLSLLRLRKINDYLHNNAELSFNVIKHLLMFSKIPWDKIYPLCVSVYQSVSDRKHELKMRLWNNKDILNLPLKLGLLFARQEQSWLENLFICNYRNITSLNMDVWKKEENRIFVIWSSQSPEMFSIVNNLLLKFLLYAKCKGAILALFKYFIINVIEECEKTKKDFVLLYPLEYQGLVSLLILEPEINPWKIDLTRRLNQLEKDHPYKALLLYSNFPKWV